MKRKNFVTLILATTGGALFALGMCMGLIAEWNALVPGILMGVAGLATLSAMVVVRRKMEGKPPIHLSFRNLARAAYGVFGALVLGAGMCMAMLLDGWMVAGIVVGIAGIAMLLSLIPLIRGIAD